jgi:putative transposase
VIVEAHDEWQVAERRYLSEESMAALATTGHDGPLTIPQEPLTAIA